MITVIGIISLLIFGGIIANIFIMNTKQNLSETNTTEFLGTVKNVATTGTGGDEYGVLCTMEYEAKLYIYHINDFIDTSEFINLQPGQLIYFRIENAWLDTFDEISDGNNITHSKPHPEVFLKAAEFLGEKPEDCVVVEDAYAGIDAAKAAGMEAVGIGDAAGYEKSDYKIQNFEELLKIAGIE